MTQRPPNQQSPRVVTHDEAAQVLAEVEQAARLGAFIWHPSEAPIWSEGFYRMLGFTPGDPALIAASFYERVHPEDLSQLIATWERALRGETVALTYRIVRLDGVTRWVLGRCLPTTDAQGRIVRILGTVEDVTDEQEADRKLAYAHAVLRDTQRAAGVGSLLYRVSTGEIEWSEELCRIVGVDSATVLTREVTDSLAHPDDREKQNAWMKRVLAGESMPPLLMRVLRSDGVTRYLETRASLVQLSTGPTVQGISIDVTARVEMEERLRHAAKMEAIGTLAAGIAHDFNNYLGVLTMHLDAIADHAGDDLDGTVRGARHAADKCSDFTRQLLTFARKQPTAPREIEVATLVRDAGRLIQRVVGASIVVSLDLPASPLVTHADRGQLESALVNLATNARDAMPRGGKLSIAASHVELSRADPRLDRDCPAGSYVLIRMADSGTGIAAEHLPRIFEPYFSTKPVGQGSGLGLATAYGSVQQHQGFMRVESVLGQGTAFEVYLPASTHRPAEVTTPIKSLEAGLPLTGRVLLVEDVDPLRELAVRVVLRLGVEAVAAADGLAALELVRAAAQPFDVVVTDLMMPNMTGGEMAQAISELWPDTRFVFMTGYVAPDIVDALVEKHPGCVMLRKPFRSHELSDAVKLFLSQRAAAQP